jgi:hypothetical protein
MAAGKLILVDEKNVTEERGYESRKGIPNLLTAQKFIGLSIYFSFFLFLFYAPTSVDTYSRNNPLQYQKYPFLLLTT